MPQLRAVIGLLIYKCVFFYQAARERTHKVGSRCAGAHSWAVKIHGLHLGFLAQAKGKRYARAFTDVFACCERLVVLRMLSESSYEKEET